MKKYLKWIFLGVFIGLIVFMFRLPSMVQSIAVSRLEESIGRRVEAGRFRYNYARNILYIEDFKIYEEDGEKLFAYFEFFNVNMDIIHLVNGTFYIRELTMVNPSLRIEFAGDIANFEDIIENIGREKKEQAEGVEEEGFIKKFEIKNITVEGFVLYYEDKIIKAENDFTLKTPRIVYEKGAFTLASTIDFYKKGRMDLDIEYREDGMIGGRVRTEKLLLDDKLYIPKALYNLERIKGIVDSDLEFKGSVSTGDFSVRGSLDAKKLKVDSKELGELFYLDTFKGDIEEIRPLQGRYAVKNTETSGGRIDIVKIVDYIDSISGAEEEKEVASSTDEKPLDIRVDSFRAAKMNLTTPWGRFTGLDGVIQRFNSGRGSKFSLGTSFIYEEDTRVGIKSVNTLKEGFDIGAETILSSGSIEITGKHLEFLKAFLPDERSYDFSSDTVVYETEYTYAYPDLTLANTLSADNLTLNNLMESYPLIKADTLSTKNNISYNFKEGTYRLAGDINLKGSVAADKTGKNVLEGRELTARVEEIVSGRYILNTLSLKGLKIALEEGKQDEQESQKTSEYPVVGIGDLEISDTTITEKRFTLGIGNFKGSNIGTIKGVSDIDFQGRFNASDVRIKGRSEKERDLKEAGDLEYLTFEGRGEIKSLNLEDVDIFLKEKYSLKGIANITSAISYSRDELDTDNTISMTGVSLKTEKVGLKFDNLTSKNIFSINDGMYTVDGKVSLNLEEMVISAAEENYTLKAYVDIKSRGSYSEKSLATENFIFLEGVSMEGDGIKGGFGSLTSKNNFSMEEDRYNLGGEVEVNNGRMDIEGMGLTLKEGDAKIVRVTPDEIRLNLLHLKNPKVRLTGDAAEEEAALEVEADDEAVEKAVEERMGRPLLAVKKFLLEGGRVEYRTPDLKYNIKKILVDVDNFTTEKNREFSGRIDGGLTGTGRVEAEFISSLERSWDFNPTSFNIDGNFEISNLDLLDFREYLSTKLPNEIDFGKLYYKGDVRLEKGKFKGENLITVKTVYIGDNTEVQSVVPLKLAVNILKDRKGNLELDVPVSGDFNDPKFRVYRVILHAIRNILVKAATSPVNILSKTFRLGTGNVISLEYDYLATTPKIKHKSTLKKVVQMMEEKEEVDVVFTLFTNREEEKRILNEKLREEKFFKRDTKDEELEEKIDEIMAERKREIEDYFKGKLLEKRVRVEVSDIPRDKPRSNIDFVIE